MPIKCPSHLQCVAGCNSAATTRSPHAAEKTPVYSAGRRKTENRRPCGPIRRRVSASRQRLSPRASMRRRSRNSSPLAPSSTAVATSSPRSEPGITTVGEFGRLVRRQHHGIRRHRRALDQCALFVGTLPGRTDGKILSFAAPYPSRPPLDRTTGTVADAGDGSRL